MMRLRCFAHMFLSGRVLLAGSSLATQERGILLGSKNFTEGVVLGERFVRYSGQHIVLVAASLSAAILIAASLGIAAARRRRLGQVILGIVGIVQTIPALALLVFMIPLFGIGAGPAAGLAIGVQWLLDRKSVV